MMIQMLHTTKVAINRIDIEELVEGSQHSLPDSVALNLIRGKLAVEVSSTKAMKAADAGNKMESGFDNKKQ